MLKDEQLHSWSLDPSLQPSTTGRPRTRSRCWSISSTRGSCGPKRCRGFRNLFLASDYVRTYTDLATMEAANEAARRAVNGILDAAGVRCRPVRRVAAARARDLRAVARARLHSLLAGTAVGRHARAHRAVVRRAGRQGRSQALESGSEEHALYEIAHRRHAAAVSGLLVASPIGRRRRALMSDLRREATTLVERLVRLLAIRLAEAQGARQRRPRRTRRAAVLGQRCTIIPK